MTMSQPAWVQMSAAWSLVDMPPVPREDPDPPASSQISRVSAGISAMRVASGWVWGSAV